MIFLQIQAEAGLNSKYINTLCKKIKNPLSRGYQDLMGHLILTTSPWSILTWITLIFIVSFFWVTFNKIGTYWFFWNKWSVTSVVKNESKVWGSWVISPSIIFSNGNLSPLTDWPSKTSLRPKDINVQVLHTLRKNGFCFFIKNSK